MRKVFLLILPFIVLSPPLIFMAVLSRFGLDFRFPDYHDFYPFPTSISNPSSNMLYEGVIGSIIFWVIGYFFYLKSLKDYKYSIGSALMVCFLLGVIAFAVIFIVWFYLGLFPKATVGFGLTFLKSP